MEGVEEAVTVNSKQIIGIYRRHAQAWAAKRASQPERPMEVSWLDRFLRLLPLHPTVLDLRCGSGEPIGRYLVGRGCNLTGVDSSPEMISLCGQLLPRQTWSVADMRQLRLGRVFDGIVAWDSFFHLCHDDQRSMFRIFRAHAAPHAALIFTSGPSHGEAIGSFEGEPLYHASLDGEEYRDLLTQNGFNVVAHAIEDPGCGRHTVWLAQLA